MVEKWFRKTLIIVGKVIPFLLTLLVLIGHGENALSLIEERGEMCKEALLLSTPISDYIGNVIYINDMDVFLLYILAFALEYCKYTFRAVHYLLLSLIVRMVLEHCYMSSTFLLAIFISMSLLGLWVLYGGVRMLIKRT